MIPVRTLALALAMGAPALPAAAAEVTGSAPSPSSASISATPGRRRPGPRTGPFPRRDPGGELRQSAAHGRAGLHRRRNLRPTAPNGAGYCDIIDPEGNVAFLWYRNDGTIRTWGFLGGTGRFDGVAGGSTTAVLGGTADGRVVLRWRASGPCGTDGFASKPLAIR